MTKIERKKEKAEPFPENTYQNISLDNLLLYSIFSLEKKNIECRFENIVAESFELFPSKFSLHGYPEYPDARRVFNALMRASGGLPTSKEKLVSGSMKDIFRLTKEGLERIKSIQVMLNLQSENEYIYKILIDKRRKTDVDKRGKMGRVLYTVERHPLYIEYREHKEKTRVPEALLRDILFSTMETSYEKLSEKMNILMNYCDLLGRNDIKEFLLFCKSKHKEIFGD